MPLGNPITIENESRKISITVTNVTDTFTIQDGYAINHIDVYRNGVRLVSGNDFLATNGSTVQLINLPYLGDVLEFHLYDEFSVNDAIVGAASSQTIEGDLVINGELYVDNITFPGSTTQIGIQSAGVFVGSASTINFAGAGNSIRDAGDGIIEVVIGGSGANAGSIGISSVQKPSNDKTYVGFAVTDLEFVGAAVTGVTDATTGLSTATVTITKTLVLGRRDQSPAQLNISSGNASSIELRNGSEVTLPLTLD